ncbi:MAG: hypothetical protein L0206_22150, partial [Actinobacteria bacterium]|nr:hypothetical protein [Actinomycetota bacterium]
MTTEQLGEKSQMVPERPVDRELIEYLSLRAGEIADRRIREREERRQKMLAIFFTVIGVLGVSGLVTLLKATMTSDIDQRFEELQGQNNNLHRDARAETERRFDELGESLFARTATTENGLSQRLASVEGDLRSELADGQKEIGDSVEVSTSRAVTSVREELAVEVDLQRLIVLALTLDLQDGFSPTERDEAIDLLRRLSATPAISRSEFLRVVTQIVQAFHEANQGDFIDDIVELLGERPSSR